MSTDKNYVSIAGKPDGEVWLVDYRQPEGATHRLLRAKDNHDHLKVSLGDIDTPYGYADALKISGVHKAAVSAGHVKGGTEDVFDINHSWAISLTLDTAEPFGRYIGTIKGGSHDIVLTVFDNKGHGKYADIDLGNWSDQSQEKTTNVFMFAGAGVDKLKVRAINADKPKMESADKFSYNGWLRGWFPVVQRILKKIGIN
jgi:hypothetical protein